MPRTPIASPPSLRWLWLVAGGLCFGLSQPFVLSPLGEEAVDPSGWSGLLAFVAFVPALLWTRQSSVREAYWRGFVTLWVGATLILYWACIAMTVFGHIPLPLGMLATMLFSATVAFVVASSFAVTRLLALRLGWPQWVAFPLCFTASYYLFNYGPVGGFPWTAPGYSLVGLPVLLQGAALFGVYGLTAFVAFINGVVAESVAALRRGEALPRLPLAGAALLSGLLMAWGHTRLADEAPVERSVRVALLQGNIEQGIKNESQLHAAAILDKYHRLQAEALTAGAELVVWPEAALPSYVRAEWETLQKAGVVPPTPGARAPAAAVIGAVAVEPNPQAHAAGERKYHRYNTAIVTGGGLQVLGRFDKSHLVPFGEYVPWPLNRLLKQLVPGGTTAGQGGTPLRLRVGDEDVRIAATICYEGIFPEITRRFVLEGAELMVNVTNDAWYGVSSAALQHLSMYAMRAVESGRPVARAANTGISAWVDPRGRIHNASALYVDAVVLADIPLSKESTLYLRWGDWVALPCTLVALVAWLMALVGRDFWRRRRSPLEWGLGATGLSLAAGVASAYFFWPRPQAPSEADATLATISVAAALLVGVGALSGRAWAHTAHLWVGAAAFACCGAATLLGATDAFPVALLGGALALLAWKRKRAYVSSADTFRPEHPDD